MWDRIDRSGECWLWTGAKSTAGYGQIRLDRKTVYLHRIAYEHYFGAIPKGMLVCHRCDVPACCNPAHLFLGTHQDNATDMVNKGRYVPRLNLPKGSNIKASKLTEAQVSLIKIAITARQSQPMLAKQFGVSTTTINNIAHGKIWRHV